MAENAVMEDDGLGSRLRSARRAAGLSTWAVAERLSSSGETVSHATIANYERGDTKPALSFLARLASLYGKPINWFLSRAPVLTGVQYRCLKSVSASQKHHFEGMSQRWLEGYKGVENILNKPLQNQMSLFKVGPSESGAAVAARLREELRLGEEPIPSVIAVLEGFGIRVIEVLVEDRIDGLAAYLGDEKVVVLNNRVPCERIRLNAAHELGHHLFEDVCRIEGLGDAAIEKRAFEFASHFLLPEGQLRAAFEGYSMITLVKFKERFGVSLAAMIYRAKDIGLIGARLYQRLWMQFSKRGWRTTEPGVVLPDRASRFETMIESSLMTGAMSWQDVVKVTGVREDELRERLGAALPGSGKGWAMK